MVRYVSGLKNVKTWIVTAVGLLCVAGSAVRVSADSLGPWSGSQIAQAGAAEIWQTRLPLGFSQKILGFHLAGENIYAIGDDGLIWAISGLDGRHLWTRQVVARFETIWPPAAAFYEGKPAVLFTRMRDAVLLDPLTGRELKRVRLDDITSTAGAVGNNRDIFAVGPEGRFRSIRISDGAKQWGMAMPKSVDRPPLYLADGDELLLLDTGGMLASYSSSNVKYFIRDLEADPVGPATADRLACYVVTADGVLHAIQRRSGDLLWHYRLVERPAGGPIATGNTLYQATATGGLYRFFVAPTAALATQPAGVLDSEGAAEIGAAMPDEVPSTQPVIAAMQTITRVKRDWPRIDASREIRRWYYPLGRQFLAEWPERVVVLRTDGSVGLIPLNSSTGEPAEILDLGSIDGAISNTLNDAVFLTSPKGLVRAVRPIGAAPLTPADFGVAPVTQPTEAPPAAEQPAVAPGAEGEPASPPAEGQPAPTEGQVAPAAKPAGEDTMLTDPLRSRKVGP